MTFGQMCYYLHVTHILLAVVVVSSVRVIPSNGGICLDECRKHTSAYYYCESDLSDWDYCSNVDQVGSYGRICNEDHKCDLHGRAYRWCYTTDASWDYCSHFESTWPGHALTRYGYYCDDDCSSRGNNYNTCHYKGSRTETEYCSVLPHTTYRNVKCLESHSCDRHGKSYYWCWTGMWSESWDYCSPLDNCGYWPATDAISNSRRIRSTNLNSNVCSLPRSQPNLATNIGRDCRSHQQLEQVSGRRRAQAHSTIAEWNMDSVLSEGARTLYTTQFYRIDLQGIFNRDGNRIANLQLQTNGINSRTVAGILVPVGQHFPVRHFRRAFVESLHEGVIMSMTIGMRPVQHCRFQRRAGQLKLWRQYQLQINV